MNNSRPIKKSFACRIDDTLPLFPLFASAAALRVFCGSSEENIQTQATYLGELYAKIVSN